MGQPRELRMRKIANLWIQCVAMLSVFLPQTNGRILHESHRELTDEWPDRSQVPSVRDIIVYRKTAREATAKVVAQLARKRFEWTGTPTITSEQHVQGVVAAYDQARRSIMDDLRRCLEKESTSIASIRQWIKEQPSPPFPRLNV